MAFYTSVLSNRLWTGLKSGSKHQDRSDLNKDSIDLMPDNRDCPARRNITPEPDENLLNKQKYFYEDKSQITNPQVEKPTDKELLAINIETIKNV